MDHCRSLLSPKQTLCLGESVPSRDFTSYIFSTCTHARTHTHGHTRAHARTCTRIPPALALPFRHLSSPLVASPLSPDGPAGADTVNNRGFSSLGSFHGASESAVSGFSPAWPAESRGHADPPAGPSATLHIPAELLSVISLRLASPVN